MTRSARTDAIARRAARVILLDATGRVLLLHGCDPARPEHAYWFTAGGGLDPGESPAEGAARELYEETGLALAPADLGGAVHHEVIEFPFDGRWYRQEQEFFVARVDAWEAVAVVRTVDEERSIDGYRWWSAADLRASGEKYYPDDLPDLVERLTPC
jgi:8-oxo-dGTP pyrophosphatase MutT (NUDIX family)